jgi:hypothetical protein
MNSPLQERKEQQPCFTVKPASSRPLTPKTSRSSRSARTIGFWLLMLVFGVAVPLLSSEYWLKAILIPLLIFSLAALGLNILTGYAGQLSLGSAAFMAVGAFAAYNFILRIEGMPDPGGTCWRADGGAVGICSACRACASRASIWRWPPWRRSSSSSGPDQVSAGSPTTRPPGVITAQDRDHPRLHLRHAGIQVPAGAS